MFELRSGELFQRALQPPVSYGRQILACTQFVDLEQEQELPTGVAVGQAMDSTKYLACKRVHPLVLAPTLVSIDTAATSTIARREHGDIHCVGFCTLLSIHTTLWDWQPRATAGQAEEIASCRDGALHLSFESYVKEKALCRQVGRSRPEEGSAHHPGDNPEYLSRRGYIHGPLLCLYTCASARLQWVRTLLAETRCSGALCAPGMSAFCLIQALLTLRAWNAGQGNGAYHRILLAASASGYQMLPTLAFLNTLAAIIFCFQSGACGFSPGSVASNHSIGFDLISALSAIGRAFPKRAALLSLTLLSTDNGTAHLIIALTFLQERRQGSGVEYISLGNAGVPARGGLVVNSQERVVRGRDIWEMIAYSTVNHTPGQCPRELAEEALACQIQDPARALFDYSYPTQRQWNRPGA